MKIKIAIAEDEELFREGISFILNREQNFEIIFQASNGKELIEGLSQQEILPDIILMDLNMPEMNGVEATKIIHAKYPNIKIIALTSFCSKQFIINMISIGAVSYLLKNISPKLVVETINEVYEKGFYYTEEVMKVIQKNILNPKVKINKSRLDSNYLSKREIEVLNLICKQQTTKEISEKLFISPRTVEGHRNSLLLKTESKNVAGLVVFAIQNDLVDLDTLDSCL